MIPCRFIFRFATGGNSDSLNAVYSVPAIPRVGELLQFVADDGNISNHTVISVQHSISTTGGEGEITVFYGGGSEE